MFNYKKVELGDVARLKKALLLYRDRVCDYSAGNIVFWRDHYGISYSLDKDALILKYDNMGSDVCYSFPVSDAPVSSIKSLIRESESDSPVCLSCLTERQLNIVKENFCVVDIAHSEDWDDYLYNAEDIVTLAGRKYNGQRNHINKFKKNYPEHSFEVINEANISEAKDFCHRYFNEISKPTAVSDVEKKQLAEELDNWKIYSQLGGILKVQDKVVGISIGEIVGDTLIVHTEKADTSFMGAYPMLTNSFAREFAKDGACLFINREEDCGVEGLRISKLSYHPIEIIKKYAVTIKELP